MVSKLLLVEAKDIAHSPARASPCSARSSLHLLLFLAPPHTTESDSSERYHVLYHPTLNRCAIVPLPVPVVPVPRSCFAHVLSVRPRVCFLLESTGAVEQEHKRTAER